MRLVNPPPKCAKCGSNRVFMHCVTLINGCGRHFCFNCFGPHSDEHQAAWERMTDTERESCIIDYERRNAQSEPPF